MHAGFCATVAPRYTFHRDREKRSKSWWWNQSLTQSSVWIEQLREAYGIRTMAQLSQVPMEILEGMQIPQRAREKIAELLHLLERAILSMKQKHEAMLTPMRPGSRRVATSTAER